MEDLSTFPETQAGWLYNVIIYAMPWKVIHSFWNDMHLNNLFLEKA